MIYNTKKSGPDPLLNFSIWLYICVNIFHCVLFLLIMYLNILKSLFCSVHTGLFAFASLN